MAKMIAINRRGHMMYTMIGTMVVFIVLFVAVHIMRSAYDPGLHETLEVQKFSNALYTARAQTLPVIKYAAYPAIWRVTHSMNDEGVNIYLTGSKEEGREALKQDLFMDFAQNFNEYLCIQPGDCVDGTYTWVMDGIPVTMTLLTKDDISVTESDQGLTFNVETYMNSSYKEYRYGQTVTITSEVPVRLLDMYERGYEFHKGYEDNVAFFTTGLLYTRAYANAYRFETEGLCGPYLEEGHISYDPVHTFLSGDLEALDGVNFPEDLTDVGCIPTATWMSEWYYLGEPSFVPPGLDLDGEIIGEIMNAILNSASSDGFDETVGNLAEMKTRLEEINGEIDGYSEEINEWTGKDNSYYEEMDCCEFRDKTKPLLENVVEWIGSGSDDSEHIIDKGKENDVDVDDVEKEIYDWDDLEVKLSGYITNLGD
ncbi:MAG: hypothetical protein U9Q22_06800, partial [Candidatus Altiarchaeota archaeon]|nr:hypothetical protein [Candidatus Altiarchaeota archaeon]